MHRSPAAWLFWRIGGPVLMYWLIDFAAKFICEAVVLFPYVQGFVMNTFPEGLPANTQSMESALRFAEKAMEILMPYQIMIITVGAVSTIPFSAYLILKDKKARLMPAFSEKNKMAPLDYFKIAGFGAAVCTGLNCIAFMAGLAFKGEEYLQPFMIFDKTGLLERFICLGLLIPLAEEFIFRGVLFRRFREIALFARSAVFASFLFALFHANAAQMIYAFISGMFLAYVYEKSETLKAPVLLHAAMNVTSLALTESGALKYLASNVLIMGFVAVLCAFLGSLIFVSIQRMNEKIIKKR